MQDGVGRYRGRQQFYHILRICERFPVWIKSPDDFMCMDEEIQIQLLYYEHIRFAEEIEFGRSLR